MGEKRKVSLVVADVDGTFVSEQKVLTQPAQAALQALHRAGIRFAITSGRPPRGMAMLDGSAIFGTSDDKSGIAAIRASAVAAGSSHEYRHPRRHGPRRTQVRGGQPSKRRPTGRPELVDHAKPPTAPSRQPHIVIIAPGSATYPPRRGSVGPPPGAFRYRDFGNLATIGGRAAVADFSAGCA